MHPRILDGAAEKHEHYGPFPGSLQIPHTHPNLFGIGLDLARLADLPADVISEARRVSERLTELEARKNEESKSSRIAVRRKALLRVIRQLLFLCYWWSISGVLYPSSWSLLPALALGSWSPLLLLDRLALDLDWLLDMLTILDMCS